MSAVQTSLLSLSYEALHNVFLYLKGDVLSDSTTTPNYAVNFASCSKRLRAVYRSSVLSLRLRNSLGESECALLWERFPRIDAIEFNLRCVTGFMNLDFGALGSPKPWCGTPALYPTGLVKSGISSISLSDGGMHVLELQTILGQYSGLKELQFYKFGVHLDLIPSKYINEVRSFSLKRHISTLEKLIIKSSAIQKISLRLPG